MAPTLVYLGHFFITAAQRCGVSPEAPPVRAPMPGTSRDSVSFGLKRSCVSSQSARRLAV